MPPKTNLLILLFSESFINGNTLEALFFDPYLYLSYSPCIIPYSMWWSSLLHYHLHQSSRDQHFSFSTFHPFPSDGQTDTTHRCRMTNLRKYSEYLIANQSPTFHDMHALCLPPSYLRTPHCSIQQCNHNNQNEPPLNIQWTCQDGTPHYHPHQCLHLRIPWQFTSSSQSPTHISDIWWQSAIYATFHLLPYGSHTSIR